MRYKNGISRAVQDAEWKAEAEAKKARQEARMKDNPDFDPNYDSSYDSDEDGEQSDYDSDVAPIGFDSNIEITIDPTIISDLEHMQQRLMELTDENLLRTIVEYSLVLCKNKGIYTQNIEQAIREKYPNEPMIEDRNELITIAFKLSEIITGDDKRIHNPLAQVYFGDSSNDQHGFSHHKKLIRDKIEEKVIKIFYPGGVEDDTEQNESKDEPQTEMMIDQIQETSIIGDIETQFDNIDV